MVLVLSSSVALSSVAQAGDARGLLHDEPKVRRATAIDMRDNIPLPPHIVAMLIEAAEIETDRKAYIDMLKTLGASGVMEARPLIDRHILSKDNFMRRHSRKALKLWLVANRLMGQDADLPPPPHPYYGPTPHLPPDAPASRSLHGIVNPPYLPPPPGTAWALYDGDEVEGIAPGFVHSQRTIPALWITGGALALAGLVGAIGVAAAEEYPSAAVPVFGPFIAAGANDVFGSGESAGWLMVTGGMQATGALLLGLGLGLRQDVEERHPYYPALRFGAGNATLTWSM